MKLLLTNSTKSTMLIRCTPGINLPVYCGIRFHKGDPGPNGIDNTLVVIPKSGNTGNPGADPDNPGYYHRKFTAGIYASTMETVTHLSVWINKGSSSTEPDMLLAVLDSADYAMTDDNMIQAIVTLRL